MFKLNEIFLYYSLELESKAHHSYVNISCLKHFASDGPRSDSGKSSFPFGLDNLTLICLSHLLPSFLSPQTLYSATPDYSTFPPSHTHPEHILSLPLTNFLICRMRVTVPNLAETCKAHRKMSYIQQIPSKC